MPLATPSPPLPNLSPPPPAQLLLYGAGVSASSSVSPGWELPRLGLRLPGAPAKTTSESERLLGPFGTLPFPPEASLICHLHLASCYLSWHG